MDENKTIDSRAKAPPKRAKQQKKQGAEIAPITEPALPLLLCLVCFSISLAALIIDRFIYPFGGELLAPVIISAIALILPSYLAVMLSSTDKSPYEKLTELGFRRLKADHIFFMIFSSLFMMSASLLLTLAFGGAWEASRGITLFGTFIAGNNDFTVSFPYLILTYAILPAFAEELMFRGVIFSRLSKVSFSFAAIVSTVLYALFGFALGGIIPTLFVGILTVFVLYTTGSILGCMAVHLLFNLYRLFLEANISAYFLSQSNRLLLVVTVLLALLISAILFFSECLRIFRKRAQSIKEKRERSAAKSEGLKSIISSVRSTLAYTPSLVFTIVIAAIFVAIVVINYLK